MNHLEATMTQITSEIILLKQQTAQNIIEIGKRLIQAKESLPHGEWGDWLKEKVDFSQAGANRFMRVATEFSNSSALMNLGSTKIFALLDVPAEQREEFTSQPHEVNGQQKTVDEMTTRELQQAIKEKKEAERRAQQAEAEKHRLEQRALKAEGNAEWAERRIKELEEREPEVVEKVIKEEVVPEDYYKLKHEIEDKQGKIDYLMRDKELLEKKIKLSGEEAEKYQALKVQIGQLTKQKDDIGRQIRTATELSGLVVKIEHMLKTDLAPIKYSRALHEARNDAVVVENLTDILGRLQDWMDEVQSYLPNKNYIDAEVIEYE